jgi:excisionase family DNA binding protein
MLMTDERSRADEMVSASEAGRMLGVSGKTVIRMMQEGTIPGYKIGFVWRFRRGDIESYRDSRRYHPGEHQED